jgi:hypothetical protein
MLAPLQFLCVIVPYLDGQLMPPLFLVKIHLAFLFQFLVDNHRALTKFLLAVNWTVESEVFSALKEWLFNCIII